MGGLKGVFSKIRLIRPILHSQPRSFSLEFRVHAVSLLFITPKKIPSSSASPRLRVETLFLFPNNQ